MRGLILCVVLSFVPCVPASAQCVGGVCVLGAASDFVCQVASNVRSRREARIDRRQARRGR